MSKHEIQSCPRCGQEFECKMGSVTLCHCSAVKVSSAQREYISQRWDRCLCHACLLEISKLDAVNIAAAKAATGYPV